MTCVIDTTQVFVLCVLPRRGKNRTVSAILATLQRNCQQSQNQRPQTPSPFNQCLEIVNWTYRMLLMIAWRILIVSKHKIMICGVGGAMVCHLAEAASGTT